MSIRTRLMIIFLAIVMIPMLFVGAISYMSAKNALERATLTGLHVISEFVEGEIFLYLDKLKTRALDFSSDGYIRDSLLEISRQRPKKKIVNKLNNHLIKNKKSLDKNILSIDVLNLNGEIAASTDPRQIGADRQTKRYFIKGKKDIYVADARKQEDGNVVLDVSVPLKDRIDPTKTIGVIVICYNARQLNKLFTRELILELGARTQEKGLGETGEIYLVNQAGVMISESIFSEGAIFNQEVDTYPVKKGLEDDEEVTGIWLDYRGIPVIGSSMIIDLGDFKWVLLAEQGAAEAFAPIYDLRKLLVIFGLVVFFIVVLVALSVSQSISMPILALSKGTEVIGRGDLDHKVGTEEKDEVGRLSRAFDMMVANLKKITASRDDLNREVAEREQAESGLLKAKEQLETTVQKLNKSQKAMLYMVEDLNKTSKDLKEANIRLQGLDKLKSMFIASMSHELRTPLNSIIGFSGIMLQGLAGELNEEQKKQLSMVKSSAKHLLALINDVIDVSKVEAEKLQLEIKEFDLSGLMQEIKDSFAVAVDEKGLKFDLEMPEKLAVVSDERRIKQIVMNLISNAIKFTDKGKIEVGVTQADAGVSISVRDTGTGIKKEDMQKLFKQFSRIIVEGQPLQEGTGLGLYLSQKLARFLGGEIAAESEFGKGCVFTFSLPIKYKEDKT